MKRVLLSWSSGKDSAWSLYLLQQCKEYDIVGLLTTFNKTADRVAMHEVRCSLVKAQAAVTGFRRGMLICRGPVQMQTTNVPCERPASVLLTPARCSDATC
jgi:diphthamide synthase (EF-2-diphthine--ammonia ligase)